MKGDGSRQEPPPQPQPQPQPQDSNPATTYRPIPPREFALGSEIRRSDNQASLAPAFTLLPSSSLRRSATGSQYSWSSRGSGSHSRGGSWRGPQTHRESTSGGRGGGLSSTSITMMEQDAASPVGNLDGQHEQRSTDMTAQRQEQDTSAMGRISEEDGASTSGLFSLKPYNPRESEENVEIFERSDAFERSSGSDSIGYNPTAGSSPHESLLRDGGEVQDEEVVDDSGRQQPVNTRRPQDLQLLTSELNPTNTAHLTLTNIKSPESISTMGSESLQQEMAATARFGRLLQQCRELTETCENSTLDESDRFGSSTRSANKDTTNIQPIASVPLSSFEPAKINPNSEVQTSTRVYNASELTMDTFVKTDDGTTSRRRDKSVVSELSMGVDRMYHDTSTGRDYLETGAKSPYSRGSPVSELSISDSDKLTNLVRKSNEQAKQSKGNNRPDFMRYLSNVTEKDDDDRRSWLSYTDDERTPRNNPQRLISTFKVPIVTGQSGSQFKKRMASGSAPQQSPQSSFYSTDFSDEGSGGLLVGFGKRRKRSSDSDSSSSSSSGFTDSSGTTDDSDTSSSSSESEEETEESEPSMPTIARRGLRLTHQQDDEVSALSFGGASALVASAPPRVPLTTPKLLPEENSRSRISESSSTPTKSLEKACEEKKESSPESETSKRSSKSSGSGLGSAGGRPMRRSSLSGTERISRDDNANLMAPQRRATIGDLPQLEEESSQASSNSPLPRKSTSSHGEQLGKEMAATIKSATSTSNEVPTTGPSEAPLRSSLRRSLGSSKSAADSQISKLIVQKQSETTLTADRAEGSPQIIASSSQMSRSSKSSVGSQDKAIASQADCAPALDSRHSLSSKSGSVSHASKQNAIDDTSHKPESSPRLPRPSKSNSKSSNVTDSINLAAVTENNSHGRDEGEMNYQDNKQSPTAILMTHQTDRTLSDKKTEEPMVYDHGYLTRVVEDKSYVESFTDHIVPLSSINTVLSENRHPNEYPTGNTVIDDDISATSSLSSVVSKARVSFLNTCSASVASVISDRSNEEKRSRGSFRKSASDMIAERQSSKSSIGSKSQDKAYVKANMNLSENQEQQLDSSVKSGAREPSNGSDLYESFPTDASNELIRCNRNETTQSHASREASEEVDSRKPWRTPSCSIKPTGEADTDLFSDDEASVIKQETPDACAKLHPADADESVMSELATSKETLISMGLYSYDLAEETDINMSSPPLSKKRSSILPKRISRTSSASSITEWDFSDQNKENPSNPIHEEFPSKTSTSASPSSNSSSLSLDEPSPLVLSAASKIMLDVSSSSRDSDENNNNLTGTHQLSLDDPCQTNSNDNGKTPVVTFIEVDCEDAPIQINRVESTSSRSDKREQYRQSMLDVAKDMSTRLEKSFLARSQQQVQANDFESRSYEDLSSASEEDDVLAYLKGEIDAEDKSNLDSSDGILEGDTNPLEAKSKASSFWSRLRNSVLKSVLEEDKSGKIEMKDKIGEGSAAASATGSEYVIAEMRPMFSGSDESSGVVLEPADDSDAEIGFVTPINFNDGSESIDPSGDKVADEISNAWYRDKEFYKSNYFLVPLCFFLLVIFLLSMIAGTTASQKNETMLSSIPTISEANPSIPLSPSATPPITAPPPVWVQVGEDIKGRVDDELGFSVSSSKLGSRFIVGSRRSDKDNMKNRGAASIYEFDEQTSSFVLVTEIYGEQAGDQCGYSVSMSAEGTRVAVGSLGSDKNGNNSGQVRVFDELPSKQWVLVAEFYGETDGSLFGTSVSLSQDGTKVAIGAPYYENTTSTRSGKAYVYEERNETLWKPVGDPIVGSASNSLLGWSVSWSPDATLLAVGSPGEDSITSSGYVEVYTYDANQWRGFGEAISNAIAGDRFGFSVHLGGLDGIHWLAIGAPGTTSASGEGNGYAGLYKFDKTKWLQVGNGFLGGWGENLGYAVSLTSDASRMVLGVPNKLINGLQSGQIQIVDIENESPVLSADINGDAGGDFGVSVSVSYDGRMIFGGMPGGNLVRVFGEL